MPEVPRYVQRRINRKHVLEALQSETGSWGDDTAQARIRQYCQDPLQATTEDYSFVGSQRLSSFYIDPTKPNSGERRSLWTEIMRRMGKPAADDPGGWNGTSYVRRLHAIAEEAEE